MKYPIGIQTFSEIRTQGYVYVDKTAYIRRLVDEGKYYFLSRPRRFGKSLLLSTIDAYFSGRKELFEGLSIYQSEKDWTVYPVIHFDLNTGTYADTDGVTKHISNILLRYERENFLPEDKDMTIATRFERLIRCLYEKTGEKVVILIDEYDKPLLETIDSPEQQNLYRAHLKPFYGNLKSCDQYIKFAMLTGVTKYSHLSVFSDLNNIRDISMLPQYAAICGITKQEIRDNFSEQVEEMARVKDMTYEQLIEAFVEMYDGYRFTKAEEKMFNPYSLLNALLNQDLSDYWFATGTPSYLVRLIKANNYKLWKLDGCETTAQSLWSIDTSTSDPIAVIYQSGYLTIKDYDSKLDVCTLGYPNKEVKRGFIDYLIPFYANVGAKPASMAIVKFYKDISAGEIDSFMGRLKSLMAGLPYPTHKNYNYELHYQNVLYIVFTLLGYYVQTEVHISRGRIDMVVKTDTIIYIMEFKLDGSADDALKQIHECGYDEPYCSDGRKIILIGINFNSKTHNIGEYKVER